MSKRNICQATVYMSLFSDICLSWHALFQPTATPASATLASTKVSGDYGNHQFGAFTPVLSASPLTGKCGILNNAHGEL
jgi:hypothetical protein